MNKLLMLFICVLLLINTIGYAQKWSLLDRYQKDSVIYKHNDKGKKYAALNFNLGFRSGWGANDYIFQVEPVYGFLLFDRQMLALGLLFKKSQVSYKDEYRKSQQAQVGTFYRYYLPERKVLMPFFAQVGLHIGAFMGEINNNGFETREECLQMSFSIALGFSIPINKFTFEIGFVQDYELINLMIIKDYLTFKTSGMLSLSYTF